MLIAIVSDIHDNLANLKKFLAFAAKTKVKFLLACGDVGQNETLEFIYANFKGKVLICRGNADNLKTKTLNDWEETEMEKLKIAFCHFPEKAKELAQSQKYDFVFYGHTHKPWLEKISQCFLANPGNLAGIFYPASFAVLDTKTKELKLKILGKLDL